MDGRSILVDRLLELSTNGGKIMFVYPTIRGATTFSTDYIGPVLDSFLLRTMALNDLPFNLAEQVGHIAALDHLMDFETMQTKLTSLCHRMNQRSSEGSASGSRFDIVYSCTGHVVLQSKIWREWYVQQEQSRIRAIFRAYWERDGRLPRDDRVTDSTISRLIIDEVENRRGTISGGSCEAAAEEGEGRAASAAAGQRSIEVGVFVIRRSTTDPA